MIWTDCGEDAVNTEFEFIKAALTLIATGMPEALWIPLTTFPPLPWPRTSPYCERKLERSMGPREKNHCQIAMCAYLLRCRLQ